MKLPIAFIERMKTQLGTSFEAFEKTYEGPTYTGLRVNTLKISVEAFKAIFPYAISPIPWTEDGFYYNEEDPVTKHPFYYAGLYYIQEPSAMAPVNVLKPKVNTINLDLCAAPGGKSLQIAAFTGDTGLLITNDINDKRVKAIVRNVEKYGLKNVLVLNEDQYAIATKFEHLFDYILIDAPCSGEGMFKKDPKAIKAWENYANETCAKMQKDILDQVKKMVKKETQLVYSTCTFSPMENEEQLEKLMVEENGFSQVQIENSHFDTTKGYAHLWPHHLKGEGHFIGHLCFTEETQKSEVVISDKQRGQEVHQAFDNKPPEAFDAFQNKYFSETIKGHFMVNKERIYLLPQVKVDVSNLHIARYGWLLGELKKERFVPSQALALGLKKGQFNNTLNLKSESVDALRYLKGETLDLTPYQIEQNLQTGYCLVCTEGFALGFGKIEGHLFKNLYPTSWRMM